MNKIKWMTFFKLWVLTVISILTGCSESNQDNRLLMGWAMEDVTPEGPATLVGQYYERISEYVHTPLKVTALSIESRNDNDKIEQAILISMDFVVASDEFQHAVKEKVRAQIPEFDIDKLFVNATHTHSAPFPALDAEYGQRVLEKAATAAVNAWKGRKAAGISQALEYVVVGHSRRVQYADGTTEMYGTVDREDFIGLEGPTDPGVDMVFCWDKNRELTGIIMNVSCPSQVTEAKYYVSADYWGELRKEIKKEYSDEVFLFPQIGAAGDISPRDLPQGYKAGEPNMWDAPGATEIAKRLIKAIKDAYPEAKNNIQTQPVFKHRVKFLDLPTMKVTKEKYEEAVTVVNEILSREPEEKDSPNSAWNRFLTEIKKNEKLKEYGPWDNKFSDFGQLKEKQGLIEKYENQDNDPFCRIEIHALRLGDVAMATNPFELYVDYGLRITGRSMAKQTCIVQLCAGSQGYLPTSRAVAGGGYRTLLNKVGPDGGQLLVNETVALINEMWE